MIKERIQRIGEKIKSLKWLKGNRFLLYLFFFVFALLLVSYLIYLAPNHERRAQLIAKAKKLQNQPIDTTHGVLTKPAIVEENKREQRLVELEKRREARMRKAREAQREKQRIKDSIERAENGQVQPEDFDQERYSHRVDTNENLIYLAERYHVPLSQLKSMNNLSSEQPPVGTIIEIPLRAIHEVKSGETLNQISKYYIVNKGLIRKANEMQDDYIQVGERLLVPIPAHGENENTE